MTGFGGGLGVVALRRPRWAIDVPYVVHLGAMANSELKRVPAIFFRTAAGREPVRDWLRSLEPADRKRIGVDIQTVEFGWPVGMPVCRSLGGGLFEVRSELSQNRISRVLFYIDRESRMVLLRGFIKKTQKTPTGDLDLARRNKALHEAGIRRKA